MSDEITFLVETPNPKAILNERGYVVGWDKSGGNDGIPRSATVEDFRKAGYYRLEDEPGRMFSRDVCRALEALLKERGIYPPSGRHDPKHPSVDAETILETILKATEAGVSS